VSREKLLTGLVAYGTSEVVVRGLGLVASALIARRLGLIALGTITVAQNLLQYALVAGDGGLTGFAVRKLSRGDNPRSIVPRVAIAQLVLSLVALGVVLSVALFLRTEVRFAVVAALSPIPILYALNFSYILQAERRLRTFAIARSVGQLVGTSATVAALFAGASLPAVAATLVIGNAITYLIVGIAVRAAVIGPIPRPFWRTTWSTIRPARAFFGNALLTHYYASTSIFALTLLGSSLEVGRYAVALRLVVINVIVAQMIAWTLFPRFSELHKRGGMPQFFGDVVGGVIPGVIAVAVVTGVAASLILTTLFGSSAGTAAPCLQVLAVYIPLAYFNTLTQVGLLAAGRGRTQVRVMLSGSLLLTLLSVALVPGWGAVGAAVALLIAEAAMATVSVFLYNGLSEGSVSHFVGTCAWYLASVAVPAAATCETLGSGAAIVVGAAGLVAAEAVAGRIRKFLVVAREV
jgi:PST family polysaccharide transporter